jgi:hypothetical protein
VITVVLALILAAGGGYGGYRLVMSRPVTVETGALSVKVPRTWDQKSQGETNLLVTENAANWRSDSKVPGVYLETLTGAAGAKLPTTGRTPTGCTLTGQNDQANEKMITFHYECIDSASGVKSTVGERYKEVVPGTVVLRTQARSSTVQEVDKVLGSATYIK